MRRLTNEEIEYHSTQRLQKRLVSQEATSDSRPGCGRGRSLISAFVGGAVRLGARVLCFCVMGAMGCECPEPEGDSCLDGFHIGFEKATEWADGDYVIAITLDGEEVTCLGTLPGSPDVSTTACSEDEMALEWRDKGRRLEYIRIRWKVEFATVTVTHDGNVIGSAEFEPTYEKYNERPRRCGPTCVFAGVYMALE